MLERIERKLRATRVTELVRTEGVIRYRGGLMRNFSIWDQHTDPLLSVGAAEIEVLPGRPGQGRYRFSFVPHVATFSAVCAGLALIMALVQGLPLAWRGSQPRSRLRTTRPTGNNSCGPSKRSAWTG